MSDVVVDRPCLWNAWLLHCLVRAQAPNAATADGFTLEYYKTRHNYINSVHFVLDCNIFFSVCFPWRSSFTLLLFQLWRQNEPSEPKLPGIQTEGPPVHHISSRCLRCCTLSLKTHNHTKSKTTLSSEVLWKAFWFGQKWVWNCVWYKPLLPSEIRSCSPFSTRVMLPIATLSCMTLRLWLVLSMGSWCWGSQTEKMLTWTHGVMSGLWLVWETHQWLVQSGELHQVWCEDALLVALDDRRLLWNQP